jgi:hemerythrin
VDKIQVAPGIFWVDIPQVRFSVLCGCPADTVKHLMKRGLIVQKEKDGVVFDSGPNAILLSDVLIQNGALSNLAEFPVLQMFYRQGMLIPGHPNNTGMRPMLIGLEEQVRAQAAYIFRGNYGLSSVEELTAAGVPLQQAEEIMRLKLRFAFDNIQRTEELMDLRIIDQSVTELRDGVIVHRSGVNQYEFVYQGESVTVDLNLGPGERYLPAYSMDFHAVQRGYFSVIHTGEGDGWDPSRPCMASILTYQGRIFLIDAGPNIQHSLTTLGISINEVSGIFHTHVHDDHFAGITSLLRSDRRVSYYAVPMVRVSMLKKLSALLNVDEKELDRYFDFHDLVLDQWNEIDGLEVKPVFSPHPVENTTFVFKTLWEGGDRSYAHLADIGSFDVLKKMVTSDPGKSGISPAFFKRVTEAYLEPADLKKIDIGGGLIHGNAADFRNDRSGKIYLSHISRALTDAEKEIGSGAIFGMQDDLIPAQQDYLMQFAFYSLREYFPAIPRSDLNVLLNSPAVSFNPGLIFVKRGLPFSCVYLLLTGMVEYIEAEHDVRTLLPSGSLIGELNGSDVSRNIPSGTYRSISYVRALRIPADVYQRIVKKNKLDQEIRRVHQHRRFLQNTWLFGEMISDLVKNRVARAITVKKAGKGQSISEPGEDALYIIRSGGAEIRCDSRVLERIGVGEFFGEERLVTGGERLFTAKATRSTEVLVLPGESIADIPVVQWKLLEQCRKRAAVSVFRDERKARPDRTR